MNANTGTGAPRLQVDVDIVCVGFGPATAGFLTTLSKRLLRPDGSTAIESAVAPGQPLQVVCYERADDLSFGVSGVVTRARALREAFPELEQAGIPTLTKISEEKIVYLLDPIGASRRTTLMRIADRIIRIFKFMLPVEFDALELPWIPPFLRKHNGVVFSLGQFMQWVGTQIQSTGAVQIWPGTPVAEALVENKKVVGVRLVDQGVDKHGNPTDGFTPGMDIRAALTVVGDGPIGAVGRQLDELFGSQAKHNARDWALGMKFVVDLPEDTALKPGTVIHTFGYPEPEIFGFLYVHPDRTASLGIFVPSWFDSPVRTAYRYLQHWMLHPYLWRYLDGGKLRSWGAKTLAESGRRAEPVLVGDGFARIGEGSGSTNVLTNSGVDEAWATGVLLAEAVIELLEAKKPFTKQNLEAAYVARRRASWVEDEGRVAEKSRDGFQRGFVQGLAGMVLTWLSRGRLGWPGKPLRPWERVPSAEDFYRDRIPADEVRKIRDECYARGIPAHNALMERAGWPPIPYDGQLLVSHQDALLIGGKVQAPPGYADHVVFLYPELCRDCATKLCVEACSGQAITPGEDGVPRFEREKCVHCGACLWNCTTGLPQDPDRSSVTFRAGPGGLHSAEN
ncbi:MAG: 4Fe-4S ferredoxin [Verrucomicrobiae bacterium]|nr:4Fe-4S ferredoxin [Verrucomicrobiae bacterium]